MRYTVIIFTAGSRACEVIETNDLLHAREWFALMAYLDASSGATSAIIRDTQTGDCIASAEWSATGI
jgi:hypothetical protein